MAGFTPFPTDSVEKQSAFIELLGISKSFDGMQALSGVDLAVSAGEIHCLVGENGSGKSTLIKIICGAERADVGGRIAIDGIERSALTPAEARRCGVQVIYQDLSLFSNLTVAENIAFERHLRGSPRVRWNDLRKAARIVMGQIGVALDLDMHVENLSVAERQLVAICRALAARARLIIMDEPTASLTRVEVDRLLTLAIELKRSGVAILFVSHKLNEVMAIADRISVLRDGRLVGSYPANGMTAGMMSQLMTGKDFAYEAYSPDLSRAEIVLSASNLTRHGQYDDIHLDVRAGEVLGITGLLGSGRTELALSLFGMNTPDEGEIRVGGRPVKFRSNRAAIRSGIAYVPEDRLALGLILDQPIGTNIVLTVLGRLVNAIGLVQPKRKAAAIRDWIARLGVKAPDPDLPVKTLSGGNQQRIVLAKWLATRPRVLILDNPTVGVDINAKDGIYEIIRRLAAEGLAVIMISDEIPEVLYHSHRILIMRQGRITGQFKASEVSERELEEAIDA